MREVEKEGTRVRSITNTDELREFMMESSTNKGSHIETVKRS